MIDPTLLTRTRVTDHATCLACGCLCDDIRVEAVDGRVVEAANACPIGRAWFLAPRPGEHAPPALVDGRAVPIDRAIGRAAEILGAARAPAIWGLSGTTVEAVGAALAIADRIGAVVDLAGSADGSARLSAFQRVGQVSSTLGEVKDRADVVVFWGVDPLTTHPRHWDRYSVAPRGRFIPDGRAGRFVIAVGAGPSTTTRAADLFVAINPGREAEAVEVVRAMVRGVAIGADRAARSAGVPFPALEALADRLRSARYGALFFGPGSGPRATEGLLRLTRELNDGRRFVAIEMGGAGNHPGASAVLSWQAGAPSSVDFGMGHPRHLPGEATLVDALGRGEVDAVLVVADDPAAFLSGEALGQLSGLPTVRIAPGATSAGRSASVAFDVARPGIEAGGTVARVDGVMLPLRPSLAAPVATDLEILGAIGRRLGAIQ